jgi:hypothetical protein
MENNIEKIIAKEKQNQVHFFEELLEEKNKLIDELKTCIIEIRSKYDKELLEKEFKVINLLLISDK